MPSAYKSNPIINVVLAFASPILFFLIIEGGTRLFWKEILIGKHCYQKDPLLNYRNKPNCEYEFKITERDTPVKHQFNECGFRADNACLTRNPDTVRIVGIGDSFTLGASTEYSKTYLKVAESELKSKLSSGIEVINGGVSGWGIVDYSIWLDEILLKHDPQVVTIGLLPNDIFDLTEREVKRMDRSIGKESLGLAPDKVLWWRIKKQLEKSMFVNFVAHLFLSNDTFYSIVYRARAKTEDSYLKKTYSEVWRKKIQLTEQILSSMVKRANDKSAKLVVILIPQRAQAMLVSHPDTSPLLDIKKFPEEIKIIGRKLSISVIDFLTVLETHAKPTSLYYPLDGHLTPVGQVILGRFVSKELSQNPLWLSLAKNTTD
jgi:lysophospholipase L1-like esterase